MSTVHSKHTSNDLVCIKRARTELRRNVESKEAVKEQEVYISLCEFEVINQIYR